MGPNIVFLKKTVQLSMLLNDGGTLLAALRFQMSCMMTVVQCTWVRSCMVVSQLHSRALDSTARSGGTG